MEPTIRFRYWHCRRPSYLPKKDDYYYFSTAEGGTDEGHQQWICRSTIGPFGPWEVGPKRSVNPVIFDDDDPSIRNTGYLDFIEARNGKWFAVFWGVRPRSEKSGLISPLGRETLMSPVEWIDGLPIVNVSNPLAFKCRRIVCRLSRGHKPGETTLRSQPSSIQWAIDLRSRQAGRNLQHGIDKPTIWKKSPNTGAHFAIYAQGTYIKPCFDPAHFECVEWNAVSIRD